MSSSTIIGLQEYSQSIAMHSLITPASSVANSLGANGSPSPSTAEHIKRPPNAFILFRSSKRCKKAMHATNQQQVLSRVAGSAWRHMSAVEQKPYRDAAEAAKREHRRRYPDYKFTPANKRTGKAKAPKTASKISDEEITRIRQQYTDVKGPEHYEARKAKKARAVKANARTPVRTVGTSTSAFVPVAVPEVAQAPTTFAAPAPQVPLSWPDGLFHFENYAPEGAEYVATSYPFTIDPCTQPMLNAQHQYGVEPTFGNENHCDKAMLDSIPAFPWSYPVAQSAPFYNEPQHPYNFGSAFNRSGMPSPASSSDMVSSSGMHSPAGSYDIPSPGSSCDTGLSSSSGTHSLASSYNIHSPARSSDMGSPSSAGISSPSSSTFSSVVASPSNSVPYGATEDLPKMGGEIGYEDDGFVAHFAQLLFNNDAAQCAAFQGAL